MARMKPTIDQLQEQLKRKSPENKSECSSSEVPHRHIPSFVSDYTIISASIKYKSIKIYTECEQQVAHENI